MNEKWEKECDEFLKEQFGSIPNYRDVWIAAREKGQEKVKETIKILSSNIWMAYDCGCSQCQDMKKVIVILTELEGGNP